MDGRRRLFLRYVFKWCTLNADKTTSIHAYLNQTLVSFIKQLGCPEGDWKGVKLDTVDAREIVLDKPKPENKYRFIVISAVKGSIIYRLSFLERLEGRDLVDI